MKYAIKEVNSSRFVAYVNDTGGCNWSGRLDRSINPPKLFNSIREAVEVVHHRGQWAGRSDNGGGCVSPDRITIVGIERISRPNYEITEL